jgi:hypothetical protein
MNKLCRKRAFKGKTYQEIFNDLRHLHPQNPASASTIPTLPFDSDFIIIDPDDKRFIRHLESMDNGSSPGLSGWTGNMISVLAHDLDCRRYLARFISAIINGQVPDCVRVILLASHLIGIGKDNGTGTRPIAVGEIFYRCAASYALSLIDDKIFKQIFLPHQYGVQVSNGCETVVHSIQQALSQPRTPYYAMCIDMKNAFNEVRRDEMLKSLFSHRDLSPLFRLAHWCYRSPTALITRDGTGSLAYHENLVSSEGTRQGGNESSVLFSLPVQRLLKDLSAKFFGLKILSILDEVKKGNNSI